MSSPAGPPAQPKTTPTTGAQPPSDAVVAFRGAQSLLNKPINPTSVITALSELVKEANQANSVGLTRKPVNPVGPKKYANVVDEKLHDFIDSFTEIVQPKTPQEYENIRIMTNATHATVRSILPFIFTLDFIESMPGFGALVGVFLDLLKTWLYSSAGMMNSIVPPLVGLIPLPLTGTVGIILGWFMSVGFLLVYASISLSRREFTDTLRAILAMVPVMGTLMANTMQSVVTTGTKMANRYERIKHDVTLIWSKLKKAGLAATQDTVTNPGRAENVTKGVNNLGDVLASVQRSGVPDDLNENPVETPAAGPKPAFVDLRPKAGAAGAAEAVSPKSVASAFDFDIIGLKTWDSLPNIEEIAELNVSGVVFKEGTCFKHTFVNNDGDTYITHMKVTSLHLGGFMHVKRKRRTKNGEQQLIKTKDVIINKDSIQVSINGIKLEGCESNAGGKRFTRRMCMRRKCRKTERAQRRSKRR